MFIKNHVSKFDNMFSQNHWDSATLRLWLDPASVEVDS